MSAEQIKSGSRILSENEALKQALKTPVLEEAQGTKSTVIEFRKCFRAEAIDIKEYV